MRVDQRSRRTKAEAACGFRNPLALEWLILVTAPRRLIATPLRMDHAHRCSDTRRASSLRGSGPGQHASLITSGGLLDAILEGCSGVASGACAALLRGLGMAAAALRR